MPRAPEWWTKPGNTGVQLLAGNALAAEFVAEETFADIREIRRIIFQMLGMDHLVFFIDACCNHLELGSAVIQDRLRTKKMKAAKRLAFDDDNARRLLWFALECGLELEPTTRHITPFGLRQRGIDHFTMCRSYPLTSADCTTMSTVEMLTKLRVQKVHLNGSVTRAVLDSATFNAIPIYDESKTVIRDSTRLYPTWRG
ncbi:hypothetical protein JKY72_01170 [Candidatus Gracilibacteria bacterium]|nr:hypothetical protein [Candidatus Gracilibacteria bacterium]